MTDATEIWQAVRGRTRDLSKTISEDERIRSAAKKTRDASYQGLTKTRRMATQEEAWESALATLEELTEVVISHHQLILSLMERVDELEQAVADGVPQPSTEGAT